MSADIQSCHCLSLMFVVSFAHGSAGAARAGHSRHHTNYDETTAWAHRTQAAA